MRSILGVGAYGAFYVVDVPTLPTNASVILFSITLGYYYYYNRGMRYRRTKRLYYIALS